MHIFDDVKFENSENFKREYAKGEYDHCTFSNLQLNSIDLSDSRFIDCTFEGCELSNPQLRRTSFQNCKFVNCKMLGWRFNDCDSFRLSFSFANCILDQSTFIDVKMPSTDFGGSSLRECDFENCDFSQSNFQNCNLLGARFLGVNLSRSNFENAQQFILSPSMNTVSKAIFSRHSLGGLLQEFKIEIRN